MMDKFFKKVKQDKKDRKKENEKYWKLPPMERIHFDLCARRIVKKYEFFFDATKMWFKFLVGIIGFFAVVAFYVGYDLNQFRDSSKGILIAFLKIFPWVVFIDFSLIFTHHVFAVPREMKKLKKTFKLI